MESKLYYAPGTQVQLKGKITVGHVVGVLWDGTKVFYHVSYLTEGLQKLTSCFEEYEIILYREPSPDLIKITEIKTT